MNFDINDYMDSQARIDAFCIDPSDENSNLKTIEECYPLSSNTAGSYCNYYNTETGV